MTNASSLPKYTQIAETLIREIASGRLADGAKLAPERDMAVAFSTSVGTLRKALTELEDKGMLERVQGSGNYVRHKTDASSVYAFFRLELVEGGGLPTAEYLDIQRLPKPSYLPQYGSSPDGHRMRRLRRLSGRPAALEEIWLDAIWADEIQTEDISESLYYYYRTQLGLWITSAQDSVGLGHVPDWTVPEFAPTAGCACGFVERWGQVADGSFAEYSLTWFDPEVARYFARMR